MSTLLSMPFERVLGVLAGGDLSSDVLQQWVDSADVVLAADGGADLLSKIGVTPVTTIGDFDSISPATRQGQRQAIHDPNQDSSDCDKLLGLAHRLGHREITLACAEGDQLDHVLGTLSSAARAAIDVRLALRKGIGWVLRSGMSRTVSCPVGTRVSLMPITPCQGVMLQGVYWPLTDAELTNDGMVSLSNRAEVPEIRASVRVGVALLVVGFPAEAMPMWDTQ